MAPAGSSAALQAALAAGADAVYLGGKQFNARQSAANFDDEQLRAAIRLAHRSGARVYVTVNTLLKDSELDDAASFLRRLHNLGTDAVIVQDPGLIAVAQATTPQLELHASTQLTLHNAAGAQALQRRGISRVVLARELSAAQIRSIREQTDVGLEVFVHGALCVAYSGQCLFSSLTGGRSGNRGQCAQPCRLPYALNGQAAGHLLSPRDLCLYQWLPELLALGLDAWKIEGRLKRPAYVATVVHFYRQAIDRLLAGEQPLSWEQAEAELAQAFNRRFTAGYFRGKPGAELLATDRPGHRGVPVGQVEPSGLIRLRRALQVGDVLQQPDDRELRVSAISDGEDRQSAPAGGLVRVPGNQVPGGQPVYRLQSAAQELAAEQLVNSFDPEPLPVSFQAQLTADQPLLLSASAGGTSVQVRGTQLPEPAISRELDQVLLARQLGKTGDSGFRLAAVTVELTPGLSLPVSELNHCRREALGQLAEAVWGQRHPLSEKAELPAAVDCPPAPGDQPRLAVAVATQLGLQAALQASLPSRIYFGASFHQHQTAEQAVGEYQLALAACRQRGSSCYLRLPRVLLPSEEQAWRLALRAQPVQGLYVANWGGVELARQLSLPFVLSPAMNATNQQFLSTVGQAEGVYLSPELNRAEAMAILRRQGQRVFLEVHSRQLLMVHEQCLIGANRQCQSGGHGCDEANWLVDRKGYRFPLRGDVTCRSYLYNSQVCSLVDQLGELRSGQLAAELLIDLELEQPEQIAAVLDCYAQAWDGPAPGVRERLQQLYPAGLTRGHWRRGVE